MTQEFTCHKPYGWYLVMADKICQASIDWLLDQTRWPKFTRTLTVEVEAVVNYRPLIVDSISDDDSQIPISPSNIAWRVYKYSVISDPYFPAFGLNTKRYFVSLRIQSACGRMQTRNNSVFGHFSPSNILTMKSYVVMVPTAHFKKSDLYCWKRCYRV